MMIGAKTMTWSWCGCLLAAYAVRIAVAVVNTSHSVSAADFSAADALILRLMSVDNVPGAALALIKDGNIVLEKGYGFRDLETHDPVTTTTLFNIGSISKSSPRSASLSSSISIRLSWTHQSSDTSQICG